MKKSQRMLNATRITTIPMTISIALRMKISRRTQWPRSLWDSANSSSPKLPSCLLEATMTRSYLKMRASVSPTMQVFRTIGRSRLPTTIWALIPILSLGRPTKILRHRKALLLQGLKIRFRFPKRLIRASWWTKSSWRLLDRSRISRSTTFNSTLKLLSPDT